MFYDSNFRSFQNALQTRHLEKLSGDVLQSPGTQSHSIPGGLLSFFSQSQQFLLLSTQVQTRAAKMNGSNAFNLSKSIELNQRETLFTWLKQTES